MGSADVIDRLWADVTSRIAPDLSVTLIALGAVIVCVAVPALWRIVRHVVTIAHEGGHAVVALATGRRVSAITLHADTSGATTSYGEAKRLPLALVAFAGYPAPALIGLGAAWLVGRGHAIALLWIVMLALILVLFRIRNAFGLFVMVVAIGAVGAAAWFLADPWRVGLAVGITWLLLMGAVRAVVELSASRRGGRGRGSDADALARLTRVPGAVWVAVFWLVTVASAGLGGWLLLADGVTA
ncbi:M50 family metallopeptidase [Demequina sp.]|uniref:M50 family metallopeptidase n=1 Tax=Demequina sp. TaxID=2050685 RepID=UPI0025E15C6E|nr:M50 family metallopeptidase [Demequina sp.]